MKAALIMCCLTIGCSVSGLLAPFPGTRAKLVQEGLFDLQCPEGVQVEPALPDGWRVVPDDSRNSEIHYATPTGETTWCDYSKAVWEEQRAALRAGDEPSAAIGDAHRSKLIAQERGLIQQERSEQAELAASERDRRNRQAIEDRANQLRREEAKREAQKQAEEEALAAAESVRRGAIKALAAVLIARAAVGELASAQLCKLEADKRAAQAEITREKRIASKSGMVDKGALYDAGDQIVAAEDQAKALTAQTRALKLRTKPCKGRVEALAACMSGGECGEPATRIFVSWQFAQALLAGESLDALEQELRGKLSAAQQAEAQQSAALAVGP